MNSSILGRSLALSLIGSALIPSAVLARGEKITPQPEVVITYTSQTMPLLEARHNINPTASAGRELAIVDNSALEAAHDDEAFVDHGISGHGEIYVYIVRKGDTLSGIAKMFGVTVNTIRWANDLTGTLREGAELVILPISGVRHTVKSGDTIQSIAKKYGADTGDILAYNDLSAGAKLKIGDEVIVPDGEISSSQSQSVSPSSVGVPSYVGYYMRPIVGGRRTQHLHGHNGVDLGGVPIGTTVMAAADGTVIIARAGGWNGGYGAYVVISHSNGTQTLYSHLDSVNVVSGQKVKQGQRIGGLGNTGKSTGPHLHFEVRGAKNPF